MAVIGERAKLARAIRELDTFLRMCLAERTKTEDPVRRAEVVRQIDAALDRRSRAMWALKWDQFKVAHETDVPK
jgi:hypothetical protein